MRVLALALVAATGCSAAVGAVGVANVTASVKSKAPVDTCPRAAAVVGAVVDLGLGAWLAYDAHAHGLELAHYISFGIVGADAVAGAYLTHVFCE